MRDASTRRSAYWGWLGAAAVLLGGVVAGLVITSRPRAPSQTPSDQATTPRSLPARARAALPDRSSLSPGQPAAADPAALPQGHVPASQVDVPPQPTGEAPPPPEDLPDPMVEPPKHNPGGVNGTRPPRPIPGAE